MNSPSILNKETSKELHILINKNDLSGFNPRIYFYVVSNENNILQTERLIKE